MKKRIIIITLMVMLFSFIVYADNWECSSCGTENNGNFCGNCGVSRLDSDQNAEYDVLIKNETANLPKNTYTVEPKQEIKLGIPEGMELAGLVWYLGNESESVFTFWEWDDVNSKWEKIQDIEMNNANSWEKIKLDQTIKGERYICLWAPETETEIGELVLLDADGKTIMPIYAEYYPELFDETKVYLVESISDGENAKEMVVNSVSDVMKLDEFLKPTSNYLKVNFADEEELIFYLAKNEVDENLERCAFFDSFNSSGELQHRFYISWDTSYTEKIEESSEDVEGTLWLNYRAPNGSKMYISNLEDIEMIEQSEDGTHFHFTAIQDFSEIDIIIEADFNIHETNPIVELIHLFDKTEKDEDNTEEYNNTAILTPVPVADDVCQHCFGLNECEDCFGNKTVDCPNCFSGDCTECAGTGAIEVYTFYEVKTKKCSYCNGGACRTCNGKGELICSTCGGSGKCPYC